MRSASIRPRLVSTPGDPASVPVQSGHFALLDDVDAQGIGGARETPGHRVVAGNPAPALQRGPQDWITHTGRDIDHGDGGLDLRRRDHLGIDAIQVIGADPAFDITQVLQAVSQVIDAALAEHDIVIQVPAQPLPQLQRLLVEQRGFRPQVVGTHDSGIASRIAAADPAFLQHGNVADPVFFCQVVGASQTVAATADDEHIVLFPRRGTAPGLLPVFIIRNGIAQQGEDGIFLPAHFSPHISLLKVREKAGKGDGFEIRPRWVRPRQVDMRTNTRSR